MIAAPKRRVGRPKRRGAASYLKILIVASQWHNADLARRREEAKRQGKRFDTQSALKEYARGLGMSVESLRVLLSKNKEAVHRILESWREADNDPRFADGADPFMGL